MIVEELRKKRMKWKKVKNSPDHQGFQGKFPFHFPLNYVMYQIEAQLLQHKNLCIDYQLHICNNLQPTFLLKYLGEISSISIVK